MASDDQNIPLNALRAFAAIAREASVTNAAKTLGITQSSVSRHLAVLEKYVGEKLVERSGRQIRLTDYGRVLAEFTGEPLDTIELGVKRLKRSAGKRDRLLVRTSLPSLTASFLIPHLPSFYRESGGIKVDLSTSLTPPDQTERYDVLLTRDLEAPLPSDEWLLSNEYIVCAGKPELLEDLNSLRYLPILSVTSRPDILPLALAELGLNESEVTIGSICPHHYFALQAALAGLGLFIGPELYLGNHVASGELKLLPNFKVRSAMRYRAIVLDASPSPELARFFCRWLAQLCKSFPRPHLGEEI